VWVRLPPPGPSTPFIFLRHLQNESGVSAPGIYRSKLSAS